MARRREALGNARVIVLVVVAVALAGGIFALDRYNTSSKELLSVETRGVRMSSALTKYKLEHGGYPKSLDELVPVHVPAVGKCPDGASMEYQLAGSEYILTCQGVGFTRQPYRYDSRTKSWSG